MARITITEAISRSPVGRTQFYKRYIDEGIISVCTDNAGKKYIESSELIRVFGELEGEQADIHEQTNENAATQQSENESELVKLLREQLKKAEQREQQHLERIDALTLRLEAPAPVKKQSWLAKIWYAKDDD